MILAIAAMIVGFGTLAGIGYLVFYKFMSEPPHLSHSSAGGEEGPKQDQA